MEEQDTFAIKREVSSLIKKSPARVTLDDGSVIDLNSFDELSEKEIKSKEKLFIFWYTFPYSEDLSCYHNATRSAIKAGYKAKYANVVGYQVLKRNAEVVRKLEAKFAKTSIDDAAQQMVARKIQRATYDVADFYTSKQLDNGAYVLVPKPLEEIPAEKRQLIDNIDNKNGAFLYQLPNRQKEMDSIIQIKNMLDGNQPQNAINVNVLIDAIKTRAEESRQIIQEHKEVAIEADGFMLNPTRLLEEE